MTVAAAPVAEAAVGAGAVGAGAGEAGAAAGAGAGGKAAQGAKTGGSSSGGSSSGGSKGKGKGPSASDVAQAGAGAAGARSGSKSKAGKAVQTFKRQPAARKILVAEFVLCMLILALSPLTGQHRGDTAPAWIKRGTAIAALFMILGLVSAGGPRAAKAAAAFGALVTLTLMVSDRSVFAAVAERFNAGLPAGPAGPPEDPQPDATHGEGSRGGVQPWQAPRTYPDIGDGAVHREGSR